MSLRARAGAAVPFLALAIDASAEASGVRRATQRRTRDQLSREIGRILAASSPSRLPSSSPLNRIAVRANADRLRLLGARLGDDDPIAPEAVAEAAHLLRDPSSPLYSGDGGPLVPAAVERILAAARR